MLQIENTIDKIRNSKEGLEDKLKISPKYNSYKRTISMYTDVNFHKVEDRE